MPVHRFSIPGHATRRDFAIYIAVANRRERPEVKRYATAGVRSISLTKWSGKRTFYLNRNCPATANESC